MQVQAWIKFKETSSVRRTYRLVRRYTIIQCRGSESSVQSQVKGIQSTAAINGTIYLESCLIMQKYDRHFKKFFRRLMNASLQLLRCLRLTVKYHQLISSTLRFEQRILRLILCQRQNAIIIPKILRRGLLMYSIQTLA